MSLVKAFSDQETTEVTVNTAPYICWSRVEGRREHQPILTAETK